MILNVEKNYNDIQRIPIYPSPRIPKDEPFPHIHGHILSPSPYIHIYYNYFS